VDTLREVLLRVNQLLAAFPEIDEMDVNPFFAGPSRARSAAVDARIRLR